MYILIYACFAYLFSIKYLFPFYFKMNAQISKKEVIIGLYESGKTLNEIQATLVLLFENDKINSIEVIILFLMIS